MDDRHLEPAAVLLGRLLLSALFLHEAFAKLNGYAAAIAYMETFGMPGAMLPLAIALELGGALMIIAGFKTRIAALMLAAFCIATAVLFHARFGVRNELLHFEKDLAIAGGFLVLAARGGGAWSVDAWRSRRERDRRAAFTESGTTRAW